MQLNDSIYGDFSIDGILEELILSAPVQRLKGVHQGGASYLVNEKWNVTRYEHSIGVMLLIKQLGGSLEEQIAGLLHDVSHTAFSHVIDYVLDNKNEDYHDQIFTQVIANSEIPLILSKYGYDYEYLILDDSKWQILEQSAPDLCADRVDYTLRDMYHHDNITLEDITHFINEIIIVDGKMYLKSIEAAEWFVETYYKEVIDFLMNPLGVYGNDCMAKALKIALDNQLISLDALLGTDEAVMNVLRSAKNDDLSYILDRIHPNVKVKEDSNNYDVHKKSKVRLIDPTVLYENELLKASQLSEVVRNMRVEARQKFELGIYIKFVK